MKYFKIALAGSLVILTSCQFFIYGFLNEMILWLFYALFYLAAALYQKFHTSSVRSQIITLLYIFVPLAGVLVYAIKDGYPKMTQTFYILLMIVLGLALIWEMVSLFLVIKQKSDEKKDK